MSPAQLLERPSIEVRLGELPVLPAVMVRLMSLSPQSEELFEEVLAVAQEDPGFALRVMHIANSAMSSPRRGSRPWSGLLPVSGLRTSPTW